MVGTAAGFLEKFYKVKRTISRDFRRQIFFPRETDLTYTPDAGVSVISNSLKNSPIIEGYFCSPMSTTDTAIQPLHFQQGILLTCYWMAVCTDCFFLIVHYKVKESCCSCHCRKSLVHCKKEFEKISNFFRCRRLICAAMRHSGEAERKPYIIGKKPMDKKSRDTVSF